MDKTIIYDNGNIKLEHLTNVQFKSKLNNKILTGKIIGQEATNFIVQISATYSAKVSTNDILQVAVPCEDEEYFISLAEYKKMKKTKLTYQESCAIVNALSSSIENAKMYISADDYYKLYINGQFVGQGPAPSYHFQYNYNVIDVTSFLKEGKNTIAVHTFYQGLINRVWQSGDNRHGLILDLIADNRVVISSDETFKTKPHSGYTETGIAGYQTQFLEEYNSNSPEVGFERPEFDDSLWENAKLHECSDHILTEQKTNMLVFEKISPISEEKNGNVVKIDFGSNYVGYLYMSVNGKKGSVITIRCGQELTEDGNVRFELRANCRYEETWILKDGESILEQFDYKSFAMRN